MSETTGHEVSAFDKIEKVKEILDKNGRQSSRLIPICRKFRKFTVTCPKKL